MISSPYGFSLTKWQVFKNISRSTHLFFSLMPRFSWYFLNKSPWCQSFSQLGRHPVVLWRCGQRIFSGVSSRSSFKCSNILHQPLPLPAGKLKILPPKQQDWSTSRSTDWKAAWITIPILAFFVILCIFYSCVY